MFDVVLFEPEIPPNTGNIIRLCANTGARLHLVEPLGFKLSDRALKRAGLDYHEYAEMRVHHSLSCCLDELGREHVFAFSTRGRRGLHEIRYPKDSVLLFGPETRGLPQTLLDTLGTEHVVNIPMLAHSRSLNLSNAVAVAVYTAWIQHQFSGIENSVNGD